MVVNIPVLSDVAFYPFARDAKRVYQLLSGAVGTSDEYTARPAKDRTTPLPPCHGVRGQRPCGVRRGRSRTWPTW